MKDIVLLVDHAIKKKRKKKAQSLWFDKKFSSSMRGSYRAMLSDVVQEQTVGRSACALDVKANEYLLQKSPLNTHGHLISVCVQFLFSFKKTFHLS